MFGPRKDADPRWNKFPDVTVTIEGGCDISSDGESWNFKVHKKNGEFIIGTNYSRLESARRGAERAILRGIWKTPVPLKRNVTRAEVFGPIGEPEGELANFLAQWTAQNA